MNEFEKQKIELETAKIAWRELQRFFASGAAIWISDTLDLVEVALAFSQDNKIRVMVWLELNQIAFVSDAQAKSWFELDVDVWAVVVKPWILVQSVVKTI